MACVMYADDLLLLSASLAGLQELLDVCILTSSDLCLTFNEAKSHCLVIGPHCHTHLADVFLGEKSLNWARSIKYLGMELMAGSSFDIDLDQTRRKFYVSVNTILRHCSGASELMKLYLCESYCLPVLMYAVESLNLCTTAVRKLNVYWNSVYRKKFIINYGNQ